MSVRNISATEIQEIAELLNDKDTIELLKDIRDNQITEEDTKGKKQGNDIFAFVGYARYDDIIEGDPEKDEEAANLNSKLRKLINAGLVNEGFHISLGKKNTKKFGDARIADVDGKVGKYVLTDVGYALLNAADEGETKRSAASKTTKTKTRKGSLTKKYQDDDDDDDGEEQQSGGKELKPAVAKDPQGKSNKTNGNEIEEFKIEQNKELGKK